jgi:hypothetical protein
MPARLRLPDGRVAAHEFSNAIIKEGEVRDGMLLLYFSGEVDFILADYLGLPFLKSVDIEKISRMDGISLQVQVEDDAFLHPVRFYYHGPDQQKLEGSVSAGLFNWFWNLQIQGPLPSGPFRLSILFG